MHPENRDLPPIVSDVCSRTQLLPAETIGAGCGDALLAAIGTGLVPATTDWVRIDREVVPDESTRETYDSLYRTYTELYPVTREQVHRLAGMQESAADLLTPASQDA